MSSCNVRFSTISLELVKLGISNFVCRLILRSINACILDLLRRGYVQLFTFCRISDNILETVQDIDSCNVRLIEYKSRIMGW